MSEEKKAPAVVREGFTKDGKPRYIRTPDGSIFQWAENLSKKSGFLECDAKGKPFSLGGGSDAAHDAAIAEAKEALEAMTAQIEEQKEALKKQADEFSKKEQVLGEEYKKAKAEADGLKKEVAALKKAAKNPDGK